MLTTPTQSGYPVLCPRAPCDVAAIKIIKSSLKELRVNTPCTPGYLPPRNCLTVSVKVFQWLNGTISWGTLCTHWHYESWVFWTVTYWLLLLHLPASLLVQWQWVAITQPEGSVKQAFDLLGKTWRQRAGGRTPSLTKAHSKQGLDCQGPLSWPSPDTHCT